LLRAPARRPIPHNGAVSTGQLGPIRREWFGTARNLRIALVAVGVPRVGRIRV